MSEPAPNLLVVDDSPANLQLLAGMLKGHRYKVRLAPSGELALEAARHEPPDLVLLDINMSGMNGYEVCQQMKADESLKAVPVIFISAMNGVIDKVKAFSVGGVDYITKPFQFEEVEARVRTHLMLRRQERQLRDSLTRQTELERLRDNLTHMIVHDMRSPISVILMSMQIMQKNPALAAAGATKFVEASNQAASQLNEMATQLLDISRMEAGQMPLNPQAGDLVETVRVVLATLSELAGERRIHLDAVASCPAVYDPEIVRRIVTNLLINAFKFTRSDGAIAVRVSNEDTRILVEVTDDGRGIPLEFQGRIFEKFSQAELRDKRVGAGLGLAFCKLAVETHGGQIGVQSEPGRGSKFWFALPRSNSSPNGQPG